MSLRGFPHSEIPGSKLVCSSPGLIAAYRVLHRLLAPRHSPYALSSLTTSVSNSRCHWLWACGPRPPATSVRPLLTLRVQERCYTFSNLCSKRTTVCRIFSCQRSAEGNYLHSAALTRCGLPVGPPSRLSSLRRATFAWLANRGSRALASVSEGWWRIPGSNR
jgi:hypothetical protein